MARKVTTTLQDDLDGTPAAETVHFALGSSEFEIDLNERNAKKFRQQLVPYIEHARRARRDSRTPSKRSAAGRRRTVGIRAWARDHGMDISERGRIPIDVVERYEAAHKR
jgi:nucleoid-associated protein Lsr2